MRSWWIVLLGVCMSVPATAQPSVWSGAESSARKAEYPYTRWTLLSGFDVPELSGDLFSLSPHAAPARAEELVIPPDVRALHGTRVSVRGFMLPVEIEGPRVTRFIMTSTIDSCHWGMIGQAHEWVMVTMAPGRHVPFSKNLPLTVFGRMRVTPQMRGGGLAGLYEITADAITIH